MQDAILPNQRADLSVLLERILDGLSEGHGLPFCPQRGHRLIPKPDANEIREVFV